jgi:hypothetical protein
MDFSNMATQLETIAEVLNEMARGKNKNKRRATDEELADVLNVLYTRLSKDSKFRNLCIQFIKTVPESLSDEFLKGQQCFDKMFTRENLHLLKFNLQKYAYNGLMDGFSLKARFNGMGYTCFPEFRFYKNDDDEWNFFASGDMDFSRPLLTHEGVKKVEKILADMYKTAWKCCNEEFKKRNMTYQAIEKGKDYTKGVVYVVDEE